MRPIVYILALVIFSGCNNNSKQAENKFPVDSVSQVVAIAKKDNSIYYTTKDSITIAKDEGKPIKIEKQRFNEIVDTHPEFFEQYTEEPEYLYYRYGNEGNFRSEVGQDEYYIVYAHFLKEKNGIDSFNSQRKNLIDIYSNINSLFQRFQYGGTYFTHQHFRIIGRAEYAVYLLKNSLPFEKTYDISKQKKLYIKSLHQLIEDENKIDHQTMGVEKISRAKELNAIVDNIGKLITDKFYLNSAQKFQYEHYQYY